MIKLFLTPVISETVISLEPNPTLTRAGAQVNDMESLMYALDYFKVEVLHKEEAPNGTSNPSIVVTYSYGDRIGELILRPRGLCPRVEIIERRMTKEERS